jgi:uracil-DNA glycosylase family protein
MAPATDSGRELSALDRAAQRCRRCSLWRRATQAVCGEGPANADVMFVGEQPGDREDQAGAPFVGPAGRLLHRAFEEAGVDVARVYLTNAVKHFKWTPRGKRRIHERPNVEEIVACHLWLERELAIVRPRIVVALGAIAARALLGPAVRVTRDRGRPLPSTIAPVVIVTVHPSSILRAGDPESRRTAWQAFLRDLKAVRAAMGARAPKRRPSQEPTNARTRARPGVGQRRAASVSPNRT